MFKKLITLSLLLFLAVGCKQDPTPSANNSLSTTSQSESVIPSSSDSSSDVPSVSSEPVDELASKRSEAIATLDAAYATYASSDYTTSNWSTLTGHYNTAKAAINAATSENEIDAALSTGIDAMAAVAKITLDDVKADAIDALNAFVAILSQSDYVSENWALVQTLLADGIGAINAAADKAAVQTAYNNALAAIQAVEKIQPAIMSVLFVEVHGLHFTKIYLSIATNLLKEGYDVITVNSCSAGATVFHEGPFAYDGDKSFVQVMTAGVDLTNLDFTLNVTIHLKDNRSQTLNLEISKGALKTLASAKVAATNELDAFVVANELVEVKYESSEWATLNSILTTAKNAIANAATYGEIDAIVAQAKTDLLAVQQKDLGLGEIIALNQQALDTFVANLSSSSYSSENYQAILNIADAAKTAMETAGSEEAILAILADAKADILAIEKLGLSIRPTRIDIYGGNVYIGIYWETQFVFNASMKASITVNGSAPLAAIAGGIFGAQGAFWNFHGGGAVLNAGTYEITVTVDSVNGMVMTYTFTIIDGVMQ